MGRYEPCLARVNTETRHIKRSKADALVNDAPLFLTLPGDGLCISFRSIPRRQQTLGSKIPSIPRTLRLFKYRPPDITMHCRTRMQWRGFCCGEEPLDLTWRPFHSSSQVLKRKIPRRLSCRSKRKRATHVSGLPHDGQFLVRRWGQQKGLLQTPMRITLNVRLLPQRWCRAW